MRRDPGLTTSCAALALFCLVAAGPALAAPQDATPPPAEPVAVSTGPAGLAWQPLIPVDGATLIVAGRRGVVLEKRFGPGEGLFMPPVDGEGQPLPNGGYRWELWLAKTLPPQIAEALKAAEEADDSAAFMAIERAIGGTAVRAAGRFQVSDGAIAPVEIALAPEHQAASQAGPLAVEGAPIAAVTEADEVRIQGADPQLVLEDTTTNHDDFKIEADADELSFWDETGSTRVMGIAAGSKADSLFVASGTSQAAIGLFTSTPADGIELHIKPESGDIPNLRLEDPGASPAKWDFRIIDDDLEIVDSTDFTAPVVLELNKAGNQYELEINGDARINGNAAAASSRELKTDLAPVPRDELLARLMELPLFTWRYKKDPPGATHLGPVAEDFHALFDLGRDERYLSPADTSGVALAAIQGLAELLKTKDAEIAELRARLIALEESLEAVRGSLEQR